MLKTNRWTRGGMCGFEHMLKIIKYIYINKLRFFCCFL